MVVFLVDHDVWHGPEMDHDTFNRFCFLINSVMIIIISSHSHLFMMIKSAVGEQAPLENIIVSVVVGTSIWSKDR